jgi:hypothetical protein
LPGKEAVWPFLFFPSPYLLIWRFNAMKRIPFFCLILTLGLIIVQPLQAYPSTCSIGDFVWKDMNYNGIQDSGEPGMDGVQVNLLFNNSIVASTTTGLGPDGLHGYYLFMGLIDGDFRVQFNLPAGYSFALQYQGGDPARDSNANPSGFTDNVTLVNGEVNLTLDAGITPVPLPSTAWLLSSTLLGLAGWRRFRKS